MVSVVQNIFMSDKSYLLGKNQDRYFIFYFS